MKSGFRMSAERVAKNLDKLAASIPKIVAAAVVAEAESVMTRSKRDYVPKDLGTLMNSGRVHPPQFIGSTVVVRLSYGGAAAPYALAVHEHPSDHSPISWRGHDNLNWSVPGTGAKYLERPLYEAVPGFRLRVAARVYGRLAGHILAMDSAASSLWNEALRPRDARGRRQ